MPSGNPNQVERYQDPPPPALPANNPLPLDERGLDFILKQSAVIAKSGLVPVALKDNVEAVALVGISSHALGIPFTAGITDLFPIEGRISLSARLRVGLARRAGHTVWFDESSDDAATCCLRRHGETYIHRLRYTIEQARRARLAGNEKKPNWNQHPAAMLRAAAARQLVNMAAQEVMLGIPNPISDSELDARGIDISELEAGDDMIIDAGPGDTPNADDAPVITPSREQRLELRSRIDDLEPFQRVWLLQIAKTNRLPNIDGPRFQMCHLDELSELIGAATLLEPDAPTGRAAAARAETADAATRQAEQDDDGRPF